VESEFGETGSAVLGSATGEVGLQMISGGRGMAPIARSEAVEPARRTAQTPLPPPVFPRPPPSLPPGAMGAPQNVQRRGDGTNPWGWRRESPATASSAGVSKYVWP